MKKSGLSIFLASVLAALFVACWTRAQTPSHQLKLMVDGVEIHTLMGDQHNALVGHLEAAGQTNVLELLRQYRCAAGADRASSELGETVILLEYLREGDTAQAVRRLEQRLSAYANILCNSYGCLNPTNRERVQLEPLKQARDYIPEFPPMWDAGMRKTVDEILRRSNEKPELKSTEAN